MTNLDLKIASLHDLIYYYESTGYNKEKLESLRQQYIDLCNFADALGEEEE